MNLDINNNDKKNNSETFCSELNNYIEKTKTTFSVDRFEGDFAICENRQTGEFIDIPLSELPENIKQGSIKKFENGNYILDIESTKKEQEEIKNLVDNLFKRKK